MTTSDQHDKSPLTRKQLREARETGATPVISDEAAETASAAPRPAAPTPPDAPVSSDAPAPGEPHDEVPADAPAPAVEPTPAPWASASGATGEGAPLTRRQAREQERIRTASVPVIGASDAEQSAMISEVPVSSEPTESPSAPVEEPSADEAGEDEDGVDDAPQSIAPVSASGAASREVPVAPFADEPATPSSDREAEAQEPTEVEEVLGLDVVDDADAAEDADGDTHDEVEDGETPTVNPAFGEAVLQQERPAFTPSFDDLIATGDSHGSHTAPSALIFTPSPGEGSLSGPVASTGEILVTGSYELPRGLGSQGHAHGVADGKEVDAVLIDGELPPASSPTPIAASSAVSTIKPAGEVIRPPAPEKGNRLMLVLAIVAGGLALALGVALVVAFTTNVF